MVDFGIMKVEIKRKCEEKKCYIMSNQRPGKWKTATLRDGSGMQTVTFFKTARKLLEEYGHEDATRTNPFILNK